jgi:hypothetical protein
LITQRKAAEFELLEKGILLPSDWSKLETSWARKLQGSSNRKVIYLILQASRVFPLATKPFALSK